MFCRVERVMNCLQVYHPDPMYDDVDIDVCIPESLSRSCEYGNIGPVDKKRGPKKLRAGYAPTKDKIKGDNNNDDDNNEAIDGAGPDSKDPHRTAWDLIWGNGGTELWALNYWEQYSMKDAE